MTGGGGRASSKRLRNSKGEILSTEEEIEQQFKAYDEQIAKLNEKINTLQSDMAALIETNKSLIEHLQNER